MSKIIRKKIQIVIIVAILAIGVFSIVFNLLGSFARNGNGDLLSGAIYSGILTFVVFLFVRKKLVKDGKFTLFVTLIVSTSFMLTLTPLLFLMTVFGVISNALFNISVVLSLVLIVFTVKRVYQSQIGKGWKFVILGAVTVPSAVITYIVLTMPFNIS